MFVMLLGEPAIVAEVLGDEVEQAEGIKVLFNSYCVCALSGRAGGKLGCERVSRSRSLSEVSARFLRKFQPGDS